MPVSFVATRIMKTVYQGLWVSMTTTASVGTALRMPHLSDKSFYVFGTFASKGHMSLEGRNTATGTWVKLNDPQGNAIALTAAGMKQVLENPLELRPRLVSGVVASTNLKAAIVGRGILED